MESGDDKECRGNGYEEGTRVGEIHFDLEVVLY
jgi:hypothetical protein